MKLKDKVAIVTGAGRGIGRAIALAFAREGAEVVVVSRTLSEVEETAALAVFLASDESGGLTGKLIGAVWDDWQNMGKRVSEIVSTDLYTLRRVTKCTTNRFKQGNHGQNI